jgi:hypothetical protein
MRKVLRESLKVELRMPLLLQLLQLQQLRSDEWRLQAALGFARQHSGW